MRSTILAGPLLLVAACSGGAEDWPRSWRTGPSLDVGREASGTAVLADGRVLVVGGHPLDANGWELLASAELYDPETETWSLTGSMTAAHNGARWTVRLSDGRVLAPDDFDDSWEHLPSELYDPDTGRWSRAAEPMPILTNGPLVALDHADALAIGGIDWLIDTPIADVMRFDGQTGRWSAVAPLPVPRHGHGVARLGREILVFGGDTVYPSDEGSPDAFAYDLDADRWRAVGSMATGRWGASSAVLADGRLLVTGGASGNSIYTTPRGTAEIYDPATETWTETGSLVVPRTGPSLTLLTDGRVMAAAGFGGEDLDSVEFWDPDTGTGPSGTRPCRSPADSTPPRGSTTATC